MRFRRRSHAAVSLICLLLLLCAFVPAAARAGVLSDLFAALLPATASAQDTGSAGSSSASDNVQTMQLPEPATNIDPSAASNGDITEVDDSALIPADGPSGSVSNAQSASNGAITLYTVRAGDTLSGIAKLFGVTVDTIVGANDGVSRTAPLKVGQQLVILPISELPYTVQKGDTLESIAKRYNSDAGDIASYNGVDDSTLTVGLQIFIPGGELGTPAPTTSSSASGSKSTTTTKPKKGAPSTKVISTSGASCGTVVPFANNPDEPVRGIGPVGTCAQIAYYIAPLAHYIQTQNIHGYNAVDLAAPSGTPIVAAAAGDVIVAKEGGWNGGYGSYVVISHGNGSQTLYAHMSEVDATVGEIVAQGQVIGKVGETGDATGPHVHFEIRDGIRNPF